MSHIISRFWRPTDFWAVMYELSEQEKSKGKAMRNFWVTDRVDEVLAELREKR